MSGGDSIVLCEAYLLDRQLKKEGQCTTILAGELDSDDSFPRLKNSLIHIVLPRIRCTSATHIFNFGNYNSDALGKAKAHKENL